MENPITVTFIDDTEETVFIDDVEILIDDARETLFIDDSGTTQFISDQ